MSEKFILFPDIIESYGSLGSTIAEDGQVERAAIVYRAGAYNALNLAQQSFVWPGSGGENWHQACLQASSILTQLIETSGNLTPADLSDIMCRLLCAEPRLEAPAIVNQITPPFASTASALAFCISAAPNRSELATMFKQLHPSHRQFSVDVAPTRSQTASAAGAAGAAAGGWAARRANATVAALQAGDVHALRLLLRQGVPAGARRSVYSLVLGSQHVECSDVHGRFTPTPTWLEGDAFTVRMSAITGDENNTEFIQPFLCPVVPHSLVQAVDEALDTHRQHQNTEYNKEHVHTVMNNDRYFIFADMMHRVLPTVLADNTVPARAVTYGGVARRKMVQKALQNTDTASEPASTLVQGFLALPPAPPPVLPLPAAPAGVPSSPVVVAHLAPLCTMCPTAGCLRAMCSAMLAFTLPMATISPASNALPHLVVAAVGLLESNTPAVCSHLRDLGVEPVALVTEMICTACSALTPAATLALMDRAIGFDSRLIFSVFVAAVLHFKSRGILRSDSPAELFAVLNVTHTFEPIALLQNYLFAEKL